MRFRSISLIALLACTVSAAASAPAAPSPGAPVYASTGGTGDAVISRRDPRTLQQIGPAAPLGRWGFMARFSRDGSLLATLALNGRPSLRLLELRGMRWRKPVELPSLGFVAVRWTDERTVVVLGERPDGLRAIAVDAPGGRIVWRRRVPGHLEGGYAATTSAGLALLLRPLVPRPLGPVLLGVVERSGRVRTVEVGGITAGYAERARRPALVVDPAGTAYIVGGLDEAVARIDLRSLHDSYHRILGVQPLPETAGSEWHGAWAGNGRLALVGWDETRADTRLLGLSVLDTRTWRLRRLDPGADFLAAGGGLLLARHPDSSLVVYGVDGRRRFSFAEQVVEPGALASNGRYVYAWNLPPRPEGSDGGAVVIDATSGSVVARPSILLNELLSPDH